MTYKIIKNAELPRKEVRFHYPFPAMEIGDGFDTPDDLGTYANGSARRQATVSSCANAYTKRHNPTAKFSIVRLNSTTFRCVRIR